ncbi:MAG TPA: DinB family protein [Granulicella sp.]
MVEPWLRGTLTEFDAVRRQVLHALELTAEDCGQWCTGLLPEELEARPFGLPSVGFQMRHIVRSLDRMLTYLEGKALTEEQHALLASEMAPSGSRAELFAEFEVGMATAVARVRATSPESYEQARGVGRKLLPSTVGGLLVHCAEHTQRHSGQMVTTAKVVLGMRS